MTTTDNMENVWNRFFRDRTDPLVKRFPGWYRAIVVETNDPLNMRRVRFKMPEIHNFNLKPEECPWAMPAPRQGGKRSGDFDNPIIDDIIWITLEKQHPYGPIYVAGADGSRRKRYPFESIYTTSPKSTNKNGEPADIPQDFLEEYLPKDKRPMSHGWSDRYGNTELDNSVGFIPIEHEDKPAPPGQDAVSESEFKKGDKPEVNNPDRKFMLRATKGGGYEIISDIGYFWKKENEGNLGEFTGDDEEDEEFEIKRSKYLTRLFNEDEPDSSKRDQRRYEIRTRYGNKFEMRDVGWAQAGGGRDGCDDAGETKTREDEYAEPRVISKNAESDERWIKWRTKGGHLLQFMDAGFHPEEDEFVKRKLIEEIGADVDGEKEDKWTERDARQMRFVTRHGFKVVLDDRGSDSRDAEGKEDPHGNGVFLKGRRSHSGGTQRGFAWEFNEKDDLNTTRWYSPKSKIIEMNDAFDYTMICTDTASEISREWQKLKENEFALKIAMTEDPEQDTYHLKLDKFNGYARLKTASGGDNGRRAFGGTSKTGLQTMPDADVGLPQGIEMRDGRTGDDGPWAELVDLEHRGIWLSKKEKLGIWRSKEGKDQYIVIDDGENAIVIRNNESGPLQLFCNQNIEVISNKDIAYKSAGRITFKAGTEICFEAGGSHASLKPGTFGTDVQNVSPAFVPGSVTCNTLNPIPLVKNKREPSDRAETANGPFDEVDEKIVKECE